VAPAPGQPVEDRTFRGTLEPRWLLTGELEAVRAEWITVPRTTTFQMPIRWMEADGREVAVGQKVLELDNSAFASDLEQNRLAESKALNDRMQKEADLAVEIADRQIALERARVEREKAARRADVPADLVTGRQYQDLQLALAKAEVALEKAREDLDGSRRAAGAELSELDIALAKAKESVALAERAIAALSLTAPSAGIFVVDGDPEEGRKLQIGDTVRTGQVVAMIPDLTTMQVRAALSDVDDGRIAPGMRARCTLDAFPDRVLDGEVVEISPIAKPYRRDDTRRRFDVVVRIDGSDPRTMRPGMSVRVEVLGPALADVLLVPRGAIDFSGTVPRASLASGTAVEVGLGPCDARHCIVESGLDEGQPIGRRS
jgi:HlyD family secretion protein